MEKLIVAADFSTASLNAARYAADMAVQINAEIILFHVIDISILISGISVAADFYTGMEKDAEEELNRLKEELITRTKNKIPVSVNNVSGLVISELTGLCDEVRPLAVIMGAQGKSAVDRVLLGSNTGEAIQRLNYPIFVIPSDTVYTSVKKMVLACDMQNTRALPFNKMEKFVRLFNAQLLVLNIQTSEKNTKSEVEFVESTLSALTPAYYSIHHDNVEKGINQFIAEYKIDLLLLVPKSRNPLAAVFHKSISKKICWHPAIPVITLPE
jgi:nucleotide-binding universal stress UspA family protein